MQPLELGRRRVAIENIRPQVDGGRFAIKRVVGDRVTVDVDAFGDGHDELVVLLAHRHADEASWHEQPMQPLGNDLWRGQFTVEKLGRYCYRIEARVDRFHTWRHDLEKRYHAGQDLAVDLQIGAQLVEAAALRAAASHPDDAQRLREAFEVVGGTGKHTALDQSARYAAAMDGDLLAAMDRHADRSLALRSHELRVTVEDELAACSAWYELFPRSYSKTQGEHGTLRDAQNHLDYVQSLGFNVVYFPPIHPIGTSFRKGKNNATTADAGDVGSPWAIGGSGGGHKAIHPDLGTLADFKALVAAAKSRGMEVALDIAFQCSPDHPYVKEHPQWFRHRPDGTIQYAENPPKKYQDIYPFDFECEDWRALWEELTSVFLYWVEQGVRVFRVDNPHTKPFAFWEWCIAEVKRKRPDAIFLSEAFTRPKVMYRLAKLGFTQSYTYFTWRNNKAELIEYLTELNEPALADVFRPNFWPNTPDILNAYLQTGGRAAFIVRLVLASTLTSNYGIYGAAYELLEHEPREPGSEEYLHSEKYELKQWPLDDPRSLRDLIFKVNTARTENAALGRHGLLEFIPIDSEHLLAYCRRTPDSDSVILVVVNLDPHRAHSGWLELPLEELHIGGQPFAVYDVLTGRAFNWQGPRAYIELDPHDSPAHVFRIR